LTQQDSACDQTIKNSSTSTQTETEDNMRSLNDIIMTDKSARHISMSKEKKLVKKLKNQAKKIFKKLLTLFMR